MDKQARPRVVVRWETVAFWGCLIGNAILIEAVLYLLFRHP